MKITNRKPKAEAIFQISLLVFGIIAISYAIGSSVGFVSAAEEDICDLSNCHDQCGDDKNVHYGVCKNGNGKEGPCILGGIKQTCSNGCTGGKCNQVVNNADLEGYSTSNTYQPIDADTSKSLLRNFAIALNLAPGNMKQDVYLRAKELLGINEAELDKAAAELNKQQIVAAETTSGSSTGSIALMTAKGALVKTILGNAAVATTLYVAISSLGGVFAKGDANIQRGFNRVGGFASTAYFVGSTARRIAMKAAEKAIKKMGKEVTKEALKKALIGEFGPQLGALLAGPGFGWALAGVSIIISVLTFKNERYQQINYQCNVWQPQTGGSDCEKCNNQGLIPCTEYQCRSLGQGCELINQGTTNQKCVYTNRNDAEYPIIKPWEEALLNNKYRYSPLGTVSPPDRGVVIQYQSNNGCIPAFTPFSFGVSLNEPARCKISPIRTNSFDLMGNLFMSGGMADYNHSYTLSLPGLESLESENITIENDGNYELYVRCEDANGNSNPANFVFKYCIDPEPDYTNPLIVFADPLNGLPIAHDIDSIDTTFYINEPSECRWNHLNQDYDNMENSMECATSVQEMNAYMLYPCTTTLTGLQNNIENKFYIRCRDQPSTTGLRNTNTESYEYVLIGTENLILDEAGPNNTLIKGATNSIKVTLTAQTSAGYNQGEATCYYSETGDEGSYIQFYNTNSYEHSQDLWMGQGSYDYYIKCIDLGGNVDSAKIRFDVETDTSAPIIARAYYEDGYLKIITDEKSECVYGTSENVGCNYGFDEGEYMITLNDLEHYVDWNSNNNFYIKCKDENGIYPNQDQCSVIIRPFDIYSE